MRQTVYRTINNVDTYNRLDVTSVNSFAMSSFQWLLKFALRALEYCFGIHIGIFCGWLGGWYTGHIYAEHFEPVYSSASFNLDEIMRWDQVPYTFARAGIFVGVAIGAIVIFVLSHKISNNKSRDERGSYLD